MDLKEKLKTIDSQLAEARTRRHELAKARDEARDAFASTDGPLSQDSSEFKAAHAAQKALGECDDRIADLQTMQVTTLKMLGREAPNGSATDRAARLSERVRSEAPPWPAGAEVWRPEMLDDPDTRAQMNAMAASKVKVGRVPLGNVVGRDAFAADLSSRGSVINRDAFAANDVAGTENMRRGEFLGIVPQLRRQFRVLDLIPTGTMEANTLPYTQEGGTFLAAETAEGDTKPEDGVTYTDVEAVAATIAAWQKIRKQALADVPALQSMINGRLRYSVELRLENEVVGGDGSGANMLGILNTSGLGAVAFDASTPVAELILDGIVNVLLANGEANGIVLHPLDWKAALVAKATYTASGTGADAVTGGSGEYVGGGPFSVTPQQMWGVPLVPSPAVAQGTALVGDFARGAQLFIREGVNVLLSDSDQDDFVTNKVTLLAEMRAALAVFRPVAFQKVALAA